ncbi:hypothetical protein NDU88_009088 [Pleurodeles waltl]|uniref:Uncharacterized protein n=1 Tax=Pleurodeles waltl TaxID=8319 RepID=A0AAV7PRS3_PLEWA|nr:hypothetical protein NDU88_009088 [Pleurodeles waltl]
MDLPSEQRPVSEFCGRCQSLLKRHCGRRGEIPPSGLRASEKVEITDGLVSKEKIKIEEGLKNPEYTGCRSEIFLMSDHDPHVLNNEEREYR